MFGSVFRSIVVIGTIYALSPVKLDATAVPSAQASTSKSASAGHKQTLSGEPSAAQSAAIAMVTGINPLASALAPDTRNSQSKDQIGDLIALGKDVCLANPGLCAEVARSAATSVARKATPAPQSSATQTQTPSPAGAPRQTAPQADPSAGPAKIKAQHASVKQPDLLGDLIEKVAVPADKAPSEKMVAKTTRSH